MDPRASFPLANPTLPAAAVRPAAGGELDPAAPGARLLEAARRVRELSLRAAGSAPARTVEVVGRSPALAEVLHKVQKFARFQEPILITGEDGVGKELIARACHLLSRRAEKPFVAVHCPQNPDGSATVSELFGHERGAFASAVGAHRGAFETAAGGVVFLHEVGDLHPGAQTLLLRALAEKEFKPLGSSLARRADGRVIAATSRPLRELVAAGSFRQDLYFRLRYFPLAVPPLRERGDDWRLLLEHFLGQLNAEHRQHKAFSAASLRLLGGYRWPGNVGELKSLVAMAYSLSDGPRIEPRDFVTELGQAPEETPAAAAAAGAGPDGLFERMARGGENFWEIIQRPFLDRDLNRVQVQTVIKQGLTEAHGSYRRAAELFGLPEQDYHKYMDFLRHHRLKPTACAWTAQNSGKGEHGLREMEA